MEIGAASNVSVEKENAELPVFQIVSATPKQTPPMIGFDPSPSHGIGLSEHYPTVGSVTRLPLGVGIRAVDSPFEMLKVVTIDQARS